MKKIIVIKMQGKGSYTSADFVSVHLFDDLNLANDFIANNTKSGKYWSACEIVEEGETIETGFEDMS